MQRGEALRFIVPAPRRFTSGLWQHSLPARHAGAARAWSPAALTSALEVSKAGVCIFFFSELCPPCPYTGGFPTVANSEGSTCLCFSRWSWDPRLCGAAAEVQGDFLPCWSSSGGRNLQQSCGAQLCLKLPLKDLLEYIHQSPNCSFCIAIFEGLRPLAIAVWGLFFNIDPYPERRWYRSLDSIHMCPIKNGVEISRHEWWINLLHEENILHHILACSNIFSKLTDLAVIARGVIRL